MKETRLLGFAALTITLLLAACAGTPKASDTYVDPEGRFSMPLIGEWDRVQTDGQYALLDVPGIDFNMYVVTSDSDDLEAGAIAALKQIGIDPGALTRKSDSQFGSWFIVFYSKGEGQGVTTLAQVMDGTSYVLVATGDEVLTKNPPEHVMKTVRGFTIAGAELALPRTISEFEDYINSFVGDIPPGLSIVIARDGQIIYSKGFGMADGPKGMAAEPDTVYRWGSMVKTVTATAIMQLYEKGLVDLDAPVTDYLDYFPAEYGITVRQLLTHSAGLAEPPEFVVATISLDGRRLTDPHLVARTYLESFTGPLFEPGSSSSYGGPVYVMLGQIVAEVSGQPYVVYAREKILAPLGMENTDFTYSNEEMAAKAASGAFPTDEVEAFIAMADEIRGLGGGADFIREVDDRHAWMNPYYVVASMGGLIGPATDVIRFAQMHLNGGELDGVRTLSPESVSLMQEMQLTTKGEPLGYGLSWFVTPEGEHPYIEHDGGGVGLWDKMRLYPKDGVAIVMMSNGKGFDRDRVVDAAANVVFSMR